jgi:hypothetical protein
MNKTRKILISIVSLILFLALSGPAFAVDSDSDGYDDDVDNCPLTWNSGQGDADSDGIGDLCDNCPDTWNSAQHDGDNDGIGTWCDNCVVNCNIQQLDADEDGIGDVCDTEDDGCDGCGNGPICEIEC